jgi:hypothetical protein
MAMKEILEIEADRSSLVATAEFNRVSISYLTIMSSRLVRCMQLSLSTIACVEAFLTTLLDVLVEAKRLACDAHARFPLMKD